MEITRIDVFTLRAPHHYRIGGHEESPGRLPGTDYYVEPQWVHAYSSATESCLVKITASNGTFGWGEAQAPLTPQTPCALIATLLGPALLGRSALATAVRERTPSRRMTNSSPPARAARSWSRMEAARMEATRRSM